MPSTRSARKTFTVRDCYGITIRLSLGDPTYIWVEVAS